LLKDINLQGGSFPTSMARIGEWTYFAAFDPIRGREMWRTSGLSANTVFVADVEPALFAPGVPFSSYPNQFTSLQSRVLFSATTQLHGAELWTTDGTAVGTTLLKNIRLGSQSSNPRIAGEINGSVLFFADDGIHGFELWRTDGTPSGTQLVRDIRPGLADGVASIVRSTIRSWDPTSACVYDGRLYFAADDGRFGSELWVSDGSSEGTFRITDIADSGSSSAPSNLTDVAGVTYFTANDGRVGQHLYALSGTGVSLLASDFGFVFDTDAPSIVCGLNVKPVSGLDVDRVRFERMSDGLQVVPTDLAFDDLNLSASWVFPVDIPDGNFEITLLAEGMSGPIGSTLSSDIVTTTFILAADANRSRSVNLDDFTILAANFGQTGRVFSQGNFNYSTDGAVNLDDFTILASQFGKTLPAPADLPRATGEDESAGLKTAAQRLSYRKENPFTWSTARITSDLLLSDGNLHESSIISSSSRGIVGWLEQSRNP
jgi:ELWxxDGT repeat protein